MKTQTNKQTNKQTNNRMSSGQLTTFLVQTFALTGSMTSLSILQGEVMR